jgi:hypothetical protein
MKTENEFLTTDKIIRFMEYKLGDTKDYLEWELEKKDTDLELVDCLEWEVQDIKEMIQQLVNLDKIKQLL